MVGIDTNMIKLVLLYKKQEQEQFESIEEMLSLKKLEKENLPVPLDTPFSRSTHLFSYTCVTQM
jgi:hypothetical protein